MGRVVLRWRVGLQFVAALVWLASVLLGSALPAAAVMEIQHISNAKLPTIDGDISEWVARWPTPHLSQANFTSTFGELLGPVPESDQKVEVWLGWNEKTNLIYIAARVTDDHFGTTSSTEIGNAWQSDDMEVYIDADNSGGAYSADNAHAQQYVLNPAGKAGLVMQQLGASAPPQTQSAAKRVGNVYTYEVAIPGWDALDASGNGVQHDFSSHQTIGLTITFGDFESTENADAMIYHAFNGLNGPVGAFMDADQFTDFRLKGLVVSQTKAGGLFERRMPRRKPVAVESSSWGEVKAQVSAEEEGR